jgi:hypothetical protein
MAKVRIDLIAVFRAVPHLRDQDCLFVAHRDLAARNHVRDAAQSGQTRTDVNDLGRVKTSALSERVEEFPKTFAS